MGANTALLRPVLSYVTAPKEAVFFLPALKQRGFPRCFLFMPVAFIDYIYYNSALLFPWNTYQQAKGGNHNV